MASECSKESLPKHKRPCFVCGRPGHLARDCKDRQAQTIEGDGSLDRYNPCLVCDEGWSTPPPRRTVKPQRRPIALADYALRNDRDVATEPVQAIWGGGHSINTLW